MIKYFIKEYFYRLITIYILINLIFNLFNIIKDIKYF